MLGFRGGGGHYLPPYNFWAEPAAARLVAGVNALYAGTGVQFKLQSVEWDPTKAPYLDQGTLLLWQGFDQQYWAAGAKAYNVQGGPINVWVAGSFEGAFACPSANLTGSW